MRRFLLIIPLIAGCVTTELSTKTTATVEFIGNSDWPCATGHYTRNCTRINQTTEECEYFRKD